MGNTPLLSVVNSCLKEVSIKGGDLQVLVVRQTSGTVDLDSTHDAVGIL